MKKYKILHYYNGIQNSTACYDILLKNLESGWKIENSCYAGSDTIIYVLSKEE